MLRRILLKVERGVRRRVCRLRSCLHIPGADQSSASSIPLSNAFLYFMIQAINLIIHVLRSWLSHLEPIRAARQAFCCPMRFYDRHRTDESIRISVVAELTCVLTPVLGLFTPAACGSAFTPQASAKVLARAPSTTQKCPRVHVPLGLPNCSLSRLKSDTRRRLSRL